VFSHDLEDFLTLLACRPTLLTEVAEADAALRAYLIAFAHEVDRIDEIIESGLGESGPVAAQTLAALAALKP
jgi:hypothetical protein